MFHKWHFVRGICFKCSCYHEHLLLPCTVEDDYEMPSDGNNLFFAPDSEESCLEILIIEDNRREGEEQFTVELNVMDDDIAIVPPRRATVIVTGELIN